MKTLLNKTTILSLTTVGLLMTGCGTQVGPNPMPLTQEAIQAQQAQQVQQVQETAQSQDLEQESMAQTDEGFSIKAKSKSVWQRIWEGLDFMGGNPTASYDADEDDPWNS